jgi:hypothetical protein
MTTARRLAASHPTAMLPCPLCANSLRASNLDAHVAKKHGPSEWRDPPPPSAHPVTVVGADFQPRAWVFLVPIVVALVAVAVLSAPAALIMASVTFLATVSFVQFGKSRARLVIERESARLTHTFGLCRRSVTLPSRLELGSLRRRARRVETSSDVLASSETTIGVYLRLSNRGRAISVGCSTGSDFRKQWAGWSAGKRRFGRDVHLDRESFAALAYALADHGILTPRQ